MRSNGALSVRNLLKIALLLGLASWGLHGQTLSLSRPARTPRVADAGSSTPPPSPLTLTITTKTIWGAIQNNDYSFTLQTSGGSGPIVWTLTNGTLPAGITLNTSTGTLSGTPTAFGTFTLTFRAADAFAQLATTTFVFVVSPTNATYGNVGDPLADENGFSDPNAVPLNSCQANVLDPNKAYRVTQNITAATPSTICLRLSRGVKLNLGGNTVIGRVTFNDDASDLVVFNGTIKCDWPDNGGDAGCLWITSTSTPAKPMRLHHLTSENAAQLSRAIHIDWASAAKTNGVSIRLSNLTVNVLSQPNAARSFAIAVLGARQNMEARDNDLTCAGDARACQAVMCFGTTDCRIHHNRITMNQNSTDETGRAILFDGGVEGGEAFNNLVISNNNRGVRIRDSVNIRVHHNQFKNITNTLSFATIHLGDPDGAAVNDLNVLVDQNTFEAAGGKMVFIRGAINATVANNTVTCVGAGACTGSLMATVRAGTRTELRLENNPGSIMSLPPEQIFVESGATVFVCNSGQTFGSGTVVPVTCPP